jgi:hypothetical protein
MNIKCVISSLLKYKTNMKLQVQCMLLDINSNSNPTSERKEEKKSHYFISLRFFSMLLN